MKPELLLRFALAEPEVGQNTAMRVSHTAGNSAFLVNLQLVFLREITVAS